MHAVTNQANRRCREIHNTLNLTNNIKNNRNNDTNLDVLLLQEILVVLLELQDDLSTALQLVLVLRVVQDGEDAVVLGVPHVLAVVVVLGVDGDLAERTRKF